MAGYAVLTLTIPNSINIYTSGIEAYWDDQKTQRVTTIDWGWMYPGNSSTRTLYLYNPGNNRLNITKTLINWNPSNASIYVTILWTPDLIQLESQLLTQTTITLTLSSSVAPTMISHITFDILVSS
jgi:hypothetical protein